MLQANQYYLIKKEEEGNNLIMLTTWCCWYISFNLNYLMKKAGLQNVMVRPFPWSAHSAVKHFLVSLTYKSCNNFLNLSQDKFRYYLGFLKQAYPETPSKPPIYNFFGLTSDIHQQKQLPLDHPPQKFLQFYVFIELMLPSKQNFLIGIINKYTPMQLT